MHTCLKMTPVCTGPSKLFWNFPKLCRYAFLWSGNRSLFSSNLLFMTTQDSKNVCKKISISTKNNVLKKISTFVFSFFVLSWFSVLRFPIQQRSREQTMLARCRAVFRKKGREDEFTMQDHERDSPCMSSKDTGESKSRSQRAETTKQQGEALCKAAYDSQGSASKPAKDEPCLSADKYDIQPHLPTSSRARLCGDAHIAEMCRSKAMALPPKPSLRVRALV